MIRAILAGVVTFFLSVPAVAQTCGSYPHTLTNGTNADANQVMANFNHALTCINNNQVAPFLRGWLAGLTMSNNVTSPNTHIDTSPGVANSDDASTLMSLPAFSKNANAAWAVGSGNGCLDSGSGLAASTWYHLFVIGRTDTGVVDQLCSTSATTPSLPTSYTKARRIGSFKTNSSSQILAFSQNGDEFIWAVPVGDVNVTNQGTSAAPYTLASVPGGVKVNALVRSYLYNGTTTTHGVIIPDGDGTTASNTPTGNMTFYSTTAAGSAGAFSLRTSTAQQIKAVASQASTTFRVVTYGWIDTRGRFQ